MLTPDARVGLANLKQPDRQAEMNPLSAEKVRPLGEFSRFVVEDLGPLNAQIREGQVSPDVLFNKAEELVGQIPDERFRELLQKDNVQDRREAILDLVWVIRSLDIGYGNAMNPSEEHKARRDASQLFQRTKALTDVEGRHPQLSWSDIAVYHPVNDPRTFLEPGANRDQEILLYRTQFGIDNVFKQITGLSREGSVSIDTLSAILEDLDTAVAATVHLNRVRTIGQFYQLDPFLGQNDEYIGHGTGAFSAWSYTAGYFLGGNEAYRERVLKPENQRAFDRDADTYIEDIRNGNFPTLSELISNSSMDRHQREQAMELAKQASDKFALFLRAHRGAIRKHAPTSFGFPAPADLSIDNKTAIDTAIGDMNDGKPI